MQFIDKYTIKLDKVLNELDIFVIEFIKILESYTPYVIVSGYVSILLGRARGTEDIDIFIKPLDKHAFTIFYESLKKKGYWCLNAESAGTIYNYLVDGLSVRFAKKDETIPNFEVKFALKERDKEAFKETITIIIPKGRLIISSLERQIAFKRYYLKSEKDIEDAVHLEEIFKSRIDIKKIEEYKRKLENEIAPTGKNRKRK